jgi:TonB family protein
MKRESIQAGALLLCAGCTTLPQAETNTGVPVPMAPPMQPVGQLIANLRSSVAITRAGAAEQLAAVTSPGPEVASALEVALDDPERTVREAAAWALGHVDPGKGHFDEAPRPVHIDRPRYPQPAFDQHVEGTVDLEVLIDEDGKIARVEVGRSIPGLDHAAIACVKTWSFTPARRKGKAIPAFSHAPITFRID